MTLIGTAYNLAPIGAWFPPFIETAIAASIFYMAIEGNPPDDLAHVAVRSGLAGGGRRIRTLGPPRRRSLLPRFWPNPMRTRFPPTEPVPAGIANGRDACGGLPHTTGESTANRDIGGLPSIAI